MALNVLVVNTGVGALNLRFSVDRDAAGNQNINLSRNPADAKHVPGFQPIPEADRQDFFEKFGPAYSSVRYSSVLLLAAGSWLLWRRRQRWFVNHLIFSLHYYSLLYVPPMFGSIHPYVSRVAQVISLVLLVVSIRHVHREDWFRIAFKGGLLAGWLLAVEPFLGLVAANMVEDGIVPVGFH